MLFGEVGTRLLEPLPSVHFGLVKKGAEELLLAPANDRVEWPESRLQGKEKVSIRSRVCRAAAGKAFALLDPDDAEHERAPGSLGARDLVAQDDLAELPPIGTGPLIDQDLLDLSGVQFAITRRELTVDSGSVTGDPRSVTSNSGSVTSNSSAEPDRGSGRGLLAGLAGRLGISRSLIRLVSAGGGLVSLACRSIAVLSLPVAPSRGLGAERSTRHPGHRGVQSSRRRLFVSTQLARGWGRKGGELAIRRGLLAIRGPLIGV